MAFVNVASYYNPTDLTDTFKGGIGLDYAWNRMMGERESAKTRAEVRRHAQEKVDNWMRLGEKAFSGRTKNAQNIAGIGSLAGAGLSFASPYIAKNWGGPVEPVTPQETTDFGTYGLDDIDHIKSGGGIETIISPSGISPGRRLRFSDPIW